MRGSGNRMRELREAKKLSQRKLAELVGTSQQQIQRIEAGLQAARIDLALKIAEALGGSLADVFPGLRRVLRKHGQRIDHNVLDDDKLNQEVTEAGVDPDPRAWSVVCLLRGGAEFIAEISSSDRRRLRQWLSANDEDQGFFVCTARGVRVLFNLGHLLQAHFLFEAGPALEGIERDKVETSDLNEPVRVFLSDRAEPLCFRIEGEYRTSSEKEDDDLGELEALCMSAELGFESGEFLYFTDEDGEEVWLRAADVALIEIPLWAMHPELIPDDDDETEA